MSHRSICWEVWRGVLWGGIPRFPHSDERVSTALHSGLTRYSMTKDKRHSPSQIVMLFILIFNFWSFSALQAQRSRGSSLSSPLMARVYFLFLFPFSFHEFIFIILLISSFSSFQIWSRSRPFSVDMRSSSRPSTCPMRCGRCTKRTATHRSSRYCSAWRCVTLSCHICLF